MIKSKIDMYLQPTLHAAPEHFKEDSEFKVISNTTDGIAIIRSIETGLTYAVLKEAIMDSFETVIKTPESIAGGKWNYETDNTED